MIERFMRTLKEQCLYLHRFQTLAEAQRIIGEFIARYNAEWLIERLGHRTPADARAAALAAYSALVEVGRSRRIGPCPQRPAAALGPKSRRHPRHGHTAVRPGAGSE